MIDAVIHLSTIICINNYIYAHIGLSTWVRSSAQVVQTWNRETISELSLSTSDQHPFGAFGPTPEATMKRVKNLRILADPQNFWIPGNFDKTFTKQMHRHDHDSMTMIQFTEKHHGLATYGGFLSHGGPKSSKSVEPWWRGESHIDWQLSEMGDAQTMA